MDKIHIKKWQKRARRRLFFREEPARMKGIDWIVMLALTLVYAVVAFTNLGSTDIPTTYYTAAQAGEQIVIEFEQTETITAIKYDALMGDGTLAVFYSTDGEGYTQLTQTYDIVGEDGEVSTTTAPHAIEHSAIDILEWQFIGVSFTAKYISLRIDDPGVQILEMAFCGADGQPVSISSVSSLDPEAPRGNDPANMFDEQQFVPLMTSHMTETYFDEVYHARTAYEQINHLTPYEITHPPLGKTLIGIGIRLFGMNPFGWRCVGTLFGVLMLPLMYLFAKRLFKKTLYAFIPTFLFAVDFMHFAQTRIATIDSYSVFFIMLMYFFMYMYTERSYNREPLKKTLLPLALAGISFGLGAATKWLCLYAGAGLALIFILQMAQRYREYVYARGVLLRKDDNSSMPEGKRVLYETLVRDYAKNTLTTLLWCMLFFIIVPLVIYYLAYIPYMKVAENPYDFAGILHNQEYMWNYHSTLQATSPHPFASRWYTWPLDLKPMFFFQGEGYPDGVISGISSMGNPAVWWGGIVAAVTLFVLRIAAPRMQTPAGIPEMKSCFGRRTLFITIAALSQYLPWVIISRETYIYHFFATVPFMLLLIGVLAKYLIECTRHGKWVVYTYLGICLVLFVMFYPVISGTPVNLSYSDTFLRWISTWPFY